MEGKRWAVHLYLEIFADFLCDTSLYKQFLTKFCRTEYSMAQTDVKSSVWVFAYRWVERRILFDVSCVRYEGTRTLFSAVDETGRPSKILVYSGFGNILETSGRFFSGFPGFVGQFFSVFSSQVFLKLFKFEQFWMWTFFNNLKTEQFFEIWMILKLNNIQMEQF
jgi:hypothetical protein